MQDRAETAMPLFSLFSGGTAHGCTEDDDYDVDDVEVLQLVSLIDSRRRPEGSSGARCKTTGARAEARAVGTTQPLAPEVSFGHLGHQAAGSGGRIDPPHDRKKTICLGVLLLICALRVIWAWVSEIPEQARQSCKAICRRDKAGR